jgi:DNA-binding transcriptional MerR regulator
MSDTPTTIPPTPHCPSPRHRRAPTAWYIPPAERTERVRQIRAYRKKGLSRKDICKLLDLEDATIWPLLKKVDAERRNITKYVDKRSDVLAFVQGKSHATLSLVLEQIETALVSNEKIDWQKVELVQKLSLAAEAAYKAERLERGESTANISVHSSIVESVHAQRQAPPAERQGRNRERRTTEGQQAQALVEAVSAERGLPTMGSM